MTGFVASSSERYSGPLDVEVQVDVTAEATDSRSSLRLFVRALDAGYFFPGSRLVLTRKSRPLLLACSR